MAGFTELTWTREMVTRFWDFVRTQPEEYFSFQVGAVIVRKFKKYFPPNAAIVDYGAGVGFLLEDILATGNRCSAVEFGSESVAELNRRFQNHPSFMGARPHDSLEEWREKFDGAYLIEVVEHLYDSELASALSSVRGLLKPGGILVVTTPNNEDRSKRMICSPESGQIFHRYQHVRSWAAASLSSRLESHGFTCIETGTTDFGASSLAMRRTMSLAHRIARSIAMHFKRNRPHLYAVAKRK
jgi:2-polyprenyl-3-methyl-5-hydroxy-6-metoxy-1,4-benzoquinol methylase